MAITAPGNGGISDDAVPSQTFAIASSNDETLVALISANSYGATGANECQISSVIDDAHNIWIEGPTDFAVADGSDPYTSVRVGIWYCAGARAITSVTVSMTQMVDAMAVSVVRCAGVTNVNPVDVSDHDQAASSPTSGWSLVTNHAADIILGLAAAGDYGITLTETGTGWTSLTGSMDVSPSDPKNGLRHWPVYKIVAATGTYTENFNLSANRATAWAVIALKGGSVVTTNANPRWPEIVHEVDFGVDPNDAATSDWASAANITNRVTAFVSRRGRDYELARTEAGECEAHVNNWDSVFDPMNTASAYSPNVRVFTPYRVRAKWNGQLYRLFTGYVERWPQKWEDERGTSRLQAVDGLATLAATQLEGAVGAEILGDLPWAYWPLDDGALSQLAKNKAVTTSASLAVQTSPNFGGASFFGADMQLQSEQSVCWRQTRSVTGPNPLDTYGQCLGAPLTLPQLSDGILVELWAKFPALTGGYAYTLWALKGSSFSSNADHRIALLQIDSSSGLPTLRVSNGSGTLQDYVGGASGYNDNNWHHYVVHLTASTARLWVDGTLRATGAPSTTGSTIDYFEIGGEIDAWITGLADGIMAGDTGAATGGADFAHVAIFEIATVDDRRVAARANAGLTGFPEKSGLRMSRLLNYANWRAGRAINAGLTFLGAAATIANQTLLAAAQDVANWENGLIFVDGSGNLRFVDRYVRFNQTLKYTFGEDVAGGEIPYETDVEIDYDPKYIYNDVTITRAILRLPLVTFSTQLALGNTPGAIITGSSSVHLKDEASIKSYFQRTLDKASGSNSISQCNAEAVWILENYAQPRPRLAQITITPSTNPTLWPVALGIEIGDLVRVKRRPFGGGDVITLDCYVEQVSHKVQQNEWLVELSLSPELLTTYEGQASWLLGVSIIGIDTIVGAP